MTTFRRCAMIFLLGCLLGPRLYSQADNSDERFSKAAAAESEAQTRRIQRELQLLKDHDWAGEYYFGDGLGVNVDLALAPNSGFVFSWNGCLGLYDLNFGDVSITNATVHLLFKYPNRREGFQGIAPELLPVRWGNRHYLIPMDRVTEFTNAINAGTEPSSLFGGLSGRFLLRRGDEKKAVVGQPNLPPQFLSYILATPITTMITSIEQMSVKEDRRFVRITIGTGSARGLKVGMELYVKHPSKMYAKAVVKSVGEHSADAVLEQHKSDPAAAVGWKLSTKL